MALLILALLQRIFLMSSLLLLLVWLLFFMFFFFNYTAPTEISPLSLHDALPIFSFSAGGGIGPFTISMASAGVTSTAFTVQPPVTVTVSEFPTAGTVKAVLVPPALAMLMVKVQIGRAHV